MTITQTNSNIYWNYFLALESDLLVISRYIEFTENNYSTYSIELAKLLIASSSEVDVMCKELCSLLDPSVNLCKKINHYETVINSHLSELKNEWVHIPRFGLNFQPWINWTQATAPFWWTGNNHVKHQRFSNYHEATLQHTINALGALLVILYYYQREYLRANDSEKFKQRDGVMSILIPQSQLLKLDDNYYPRHLLIN